MSDAKKCDKCKKFYDAYKLELSETTASDIGTYTYSISIAVHKPNQPNNVLDFCKECIHPLVANLVGRI